MGAVVEDKIAATSTASLNTERSSSPLLSVVGAGDVDAVSVGVVKS